MNDTGEADGLNTDDWYLTENGRRLGPLTTADLLEQLEAGKIGRNTPVWRVGFSDWQALHTTSLGTFVRDNPPPVAPAHVNNGLVWTIGVAPLAYMFLAGFILLYRQEHPYEEHAFLGFVNFIVPATINAALCLADERQLKRAGYADNWLTLLGVLLAPAYLFLRANRLRQFPSYAVVWIVCFIFSIWMLLPGG